MSHVRETIRALRVGMPVSHGGLSMIPLLTRDDTPPPATEYLILREALTAGVVRITEISESGSVPQLAVANDSDRPVLLVDGEELLGAKQNRVVNLTILVPAHHTLPIPVSCVEMGRWAYASREFGESKQMLFAGARAQKARDVTRALRETGARNADQGEVWSGIAAAAQSLGVNSLTGAMSDVYARHDVSLGAYEGAFVAVPGQVGVVFATGAEVVGLDLFDAPATLGAYLPKLVRGHALEGLAREVAHGRPKSSSDDSYVDSRALAHRAADFLECVASAPVSTHPAVGLGVDLRLETGDAAGGALEYAGRVVHLTAFDPRAAERSRQGPRAPGRSEPRPSRARDNRPVLGSLLAAGHLAINDAPILHSEPMPQRRDGGMWDRVEGMLLGLAIGDSLGNTSEARNAGERRAMHGEIRDYLPNRHAGGRAVGLPSDDTQLAFWTLEHLLEHDGLVPERLAERFSRQEIYGIGSTVKTFLRRYKAGGRPWHELGVESAGNGALMRIAPVLVPHLARPSAALWADVVLAGALTHNDRASTSACVAFVKILWDLLSMREAPAPEWWLDAYCEVAGPLEGGARYRSRVPGDDYAGSVTRFVDTRVRSALRAGVSVREACDGWYSGAFLLETVPAALYVLARHAHDPEEAIVRAVNDTRDNDTVAAIVGAAVGALHGRAGLPRRWVEALLGRTGADDDGRIFELIDRARVRWWG